MLLAYPCMITHICLVTGVQQIPGVDELLEPIHTIDLGLNRDVANPMDRQARKRADMLANILRQIR